MLRTSHVEGAMLIETAAILLIVGFSTIALYGHLLVAQAVLARKARR
jgi:hypothetical protein